MCYQQVSQYEEEIADLKDQVECAEAAAEEKSQQSANSDKKLRDVETEKHTLEEKLNQLSQQHGDAEQVLYSSS